MNSVSRLFTPPDRIRRNLCWIASSVLGTILLVCPALVLASKASPRPPERQRKSVKKSRVSLNKRRARPVRPVADELRESNGADENEDIEGRQNWFMFQRAYPLGSVPDDARRRAWDSRPDRGKGRSGSESVQTPTWQSIGPVSTVPHPSNTFGLNSGRINAIAISAADPQVVLVGASTGGIWRSVDSGNSFTPVADSQVDLAVGAIAFSRSSPNTVYAGMGDMSACCSYLGSGVLKSTDGGQNWTRINNPSLPQPGAIGAIAVDPTNPNRLYVGLYRSLDTSTAGKFPYGGFYLSTDGGVNWMNTLPGLPRDIMISSADPQTIYVAMRGVGQSGNAGTGGVFRSIDGGNTWNMIYTSSFPPAFETGGLRDIRVAISAANPQKIYVYSGTTSSTRVDVSTDGGAHWANLGAPGLDVGQFGYNTYIYADPANAETVYVGTRDVFKSIDGAVSWTNLTRTNFSYSLALAHPDQHALAFSPVDSKVIYIGNDGGLYGSPDAGKSFQSLNTTLSLTQFVSIARHPTDSLITYGGTQDNGTQKRLTGNPDQWRDFAGGDGGHCVINPLDPTIVFATYVHGTVWRFSNNGDSPRTTVATDSRFKDAGGSDERTAFYPPLTGNRVNAQIYFGTQRVWTSTDLGNTWAPTGPAPDLTRGGTDVLNAISVARANTNIIYTGSMNGRAMVSSDDGQTWTDITGGLPNRTITWIAIDNSDAAVAYLAVSGFGSGHIFKTVNTGQTWTDISGNLPNIPANALLVDPANANVIYAGTDIGVFRSTTAGNTWTTFNDGMPPVIVMGFAVNNSGQIQVATYGRGAYEAVVSASDFSLVPDTTSQTVLLGGSVSYNINTATIIGNPQVVNLSLSGSPPSTTFSFTPAAVTSGSSAVLQLNTNSFTPPGNYALAITGTAGVMRSTTVTMTVAVPAPNQIDDSRNFVAQQYRDFLNREPDPAGLEYWTSQLTPCGNDIRCLHDRRIGVSAAFFMELEFQQTGSFVYRLYQGALGRQPNYAEFTADRTQVVAGPNLDASKQAVTLAFIERSELVQRYAEQTTAASFVDALVAIFQQSSGVDISGQRSMLIAQYNSGSDMNTSRALALREAIDNASFISAVYNPSFVLMQYFGYLHRDPDQGGYGFWLNVLNNREPNNFRGMVCSFITSPEYQLRFGSSVTRTNRDCQ